MVTFHDGLAETSTPTTTVIETDVLIVGSGPAGASAALFLSTLGIPNILITKYRWTANTPRAHITNQRTMEIFRDVGIEDQVLADATPHHMIGDTVFCTAIAGEEIGRILTWGNHPARHADYELASPSLNCDIPQTYLEPILVRNATVRGTQSQFSTEYLGHTQDEDGVDVRVLNRLTGTEYTIRAKYLIGADGARSTVAADLGLPYEGQTDIAGSMNITFKADLGHLCGHRPSVLYWVIQPGADVGGIGAGLVRMVRPWNEWLIVWGFDLAQGVPEVSSDDALQIVRNLVGDPLLDAEITGISLWGNNEQYATRLQRGRVFCAGDAVHKHPPSNGLGSNTSIQDSYNLAWKLAMVLSGQAGAGLLDSYEAERAPVGKQIVLRANKSIEEFAPVFTALGFTSTDDPEQQVANMRARIEATPEAERQRAALRTALDLKNYEFNAHGVELGQRYASAAVVGDGTPEPAYDRDPELYYHPTTWPGARLPHCWLGRGNHRISTHDVAGKRRFTVLTGIAGRTWADAAAGTARALGIDLVAAVIGPGCEYTDLYDDWSRLREVTESGCVLVRPDAHVGWRAHTMPDDPEKALTEALAKLLDREDSP